jgi:hypothetical protein
MMIAKHIHMNNHSKSSIVRLVNYVTSDQKKAHRVGEIIISNCKHDDPDLAAREMLMTQLKNRRAKSDKTYHLMVSFRPGEDPTPETIRRAEADLCKRLGFAEHQRIAVVHRDTNSVHLHVAVNKIHPKRFSIRDPYMDHFALGKECEKLEARLMLRSDNHAATGKTGAERKAGDIEAVTGQQSLLSYIREECLPALAAAQTWEEFHRELAKAGLTIKVQNNGVNFVAVTGGHVTGSGVDRSFSKGNLEKRLGAFRPTPEDCKAITPEKTFRRKPLGPDNPLRAEFAELKEKREETAARHISAIRDQHRRKVEEIRRENRDDRKHARRILAGRTAKRRLYAAIDAKYRARMERIREEYKQQRQTVYQQTPRHNWLAWLQEQAKTGRLEALMALRSRAFGLAKQVGAAILGEKSGTDNLLEGKKVDSVTKHGTVIYSFGADALRDDGESFRIARTASIDTAIMALQLAKKRFGEPLHINGDSVFRETMVRAAVEGKVFVTFSDPALEKQRKQFQAVLRQKEQEGREAPDRGRW